MSKVQRVRVAIACAATAVALEASAQHPAAPSAPKLAVVQPDRSLPLDQPMQRPTGLAWDPTPSRPRLWLTDAGVSKVFAVNPAGKGTLHELAVAGSILPGPAAFDVRRQRLWAVDQSQDQTRLIRGFRWPKQGQSAPDSDLQPLSSVDLPELSHRPKIRGIAVDSTRDSSTHGRIVWVCRGGGLCSTIEVYHVNRGEMLAQFFPRCEPESISIDPDGRRLWILANNGPDRSMVLVERWLTGKADEPIPEPSVLETRRYLELPPEFPRATAIAATGDAIWALVEGPRTSGKHPTVNVQLLRFPVGSHPVPP
jgi:hypothetical protein